MLAYTLAGRVSIHSGKVIRHLGRVSIHSGRVSIGSGKLAYIQERLAHTPGRLAYTRDRLAYTPGGLVYTWERLAYTPGKVSIHSGRTEPDAPNEQEKSCVLKQAETVMNHVELAKKQKN